MANKMHVKKGDIVQVISGKDKGKVGKVITSYIKENRVRVEGVNMITKHKKPTQANQQGGIVKEEGKIHASNVLLYNEALGRGVRTKIQITEDGKKVRVCTKTNAVLDN